MNKVVSPFRQQFLLLLRLLPLLCLACPYAFAEGNAELPLWNPDKWASEFIYETKGNEYETTRMRICQVTNDPKWDPALPDVFGGKEIKLRDREAEVIAKLDSLTSLIRAAEPIRWTKDARHSADDEKICYHYSLHRYILKNTPTSCMILYFSNDECNLERFCLVTRKVPFTAGEEFFLYPNVYPETGRTVIDWKADISSWNALTEYGRYFCMLSLPAIARNNLKVFSVNPEPTQKGSSHMTKSRQRLEGGWECYSRAELLDLIKRFNDDKGFHAPWYDYLRQFLRKYPGKTVEQISVLECLSMKDTACLFYIMQVEKKLGEYGLLAWDYGRLLTVLRWGIGAGWLSEQEAMQYARPLIDEILDCYASWEDYLAHYTIGRGLFALDSGYDIPVHLYGVLYDSLNYARNYETVDKEHQLSFRGAAFPAKKQNGNPVLSYNDVWYTPTSLAKEWERAYAISKKDPFYIKMQDAYELEMFCGTKQKIPCLAIKYIDLIEPKGLPPKEILSNYGIASSTLKKIVPEKQGIQSRYGMYVDFYGAYLSKLLELEDYQQLYWVLWDLDDENTTDSTLCLLYSFYYYVKAKDAKNQKKVMEYKQKAIDFYIRPSDKKLTADDEEAQPIFDQLEEMLRRGIRVTFK
ncbi:MAG: DUF1266 domain-containing protein [Treponema sp.]|nr:DUF1266 domain-containing protein [Treponema sp.]